MITRLLNSTLSHSQTLKLYKASIAVEDRKRRAIEKKGVESLYSMFRQIQNEYRINPNLSASQNVNILNDLFYAAMISMQPYLSDVALAGSSFGRQQVIDISNRRSTYQVKKTAEFEIEVNWAQADDDVLQWLNTGSDYTSSHFDMVTRTLSYSNEYWLRNDYRRYVNGEIDLDTTLNRLTENLLGRRRAELIIRTNVTDIFARGQQEAYRASGTTRNQWYTRFDQRVCKICEPLHGSIAPIGGEFAGTRHTRPSAHMGCRCFLSPVALNKQEVENYFSNRGVVPTISVDSTKPINVTSPKNPRKPKPESKTYEQTREEVKEFLRNSPLVYKKQRQKIVEAEEQARLVYDGLNQKLAKYKVSGDKEGERSATTELDKQIDAMKKLKEDKDRLEKQTKEENLRRLQQPKHQDIKIDSAWDLNSTPNIQEGYRVFNSMISDRYSLGSQVPVRQSSYNGASNRAFYLNEALWLYDTVKAETVVHELGHYLEYKSTKIQDAVFDFYNRRTKGESFEKMDTLFPGYGYNLNEEVKKDKFIHPYVGKDYGGKGKGSEILSMGLEHMFKDPVKFLKDDEEHFNLIYDIMTGKVLD